MKHSDETASAPTQSLSFDVDLPHPPETVWRALTDPDRLAEWQRFYNEVRPHGGIGGKSPQQRWAEVAELTPTRAEMDARYDPKKEPTTIQRGKRRWLTTR